MEDYQNDQAIEQKQDESVNNSQQQNNGGGIFVIITMAITIGIVVTFYSCNGIKIFNTTHKYTYKSSDDIYSSINRTLKITSQDSSEDREVTDIMKARVSSYGESLGYSDIEYERKGMLYYEGTFNGKEYYIADDTLEDGFYYIYDPNTDTWEVNDKVFKR